MKWLRLCSVAAALAMHSISVCASPTAKATPAIANAAPAPDGPVYNLTAQQWHEDLSFMADELRRRHPNLYHSVPKTQFDAAVADLDRRIPNLQRNEIIVGMMRIAAMVGDGHTRVDPRKDSRFGFPSLPLRLYLFDDGLYVRAAAPEQAKLVGAKIVAIGGVPVDQAISRVSAIISKDNEMAVKLMAPIFLNMPDILQALQLSPRRDAAVLKLEKAGRSWTVQVPAGEIAALWPPDTDGSFINPKGWLDARTTDQAPVWLQAPLDLHRMVALPEQHALYTQLNQVTGIKDESLTDFGVKIRKESERANPAKLIVDLRLNYGGNWDLRSGYISELIKAEDDDTQLFVLSGRGSFSATEAVLVDLRRLTKAVFIGEPGSSRPNSYGDGYRARMPNSGIAIQTSIYWNQLAGQSNVPWTGVHIAAPLTFADYAAGRDPALEAVFNYSPRPLLFPTLLTAAQQGGTQSALDALASYQADPLNRYLNFPQIVPQSAELLSGAKQNEVAFAVAQSAIRQYPQSVPAWNVLAFVAHSAGHDDVALAAARRTVELDPNNRSVRDLLEKLGG